MNILDLDPHDQKAIEQIAALLVQALPQGWPTLVEALDEVKGSLGENRISRVAMGDQDTVVGWVGAIRHYGGHAWELHPLVVHPSHRRQGIGRALVTDLERQVAAYGAVTLHLGTDDENDQTSLAGVDLYPKVLEHVAQIQNLRGHPYEFYQRLGFEIVGVIPDANGFGKPDILMAKRVQTTGG